MFRAAAVFCLLFVFGPGYAADPAENYQALVAAAKQGGRPVDWQALRLAYAETADFDVLGVRTAAERKKMFDAFNAGDFTGAAQQATQILDRDYVDLDAHMICDLAFRKLGDSAQAAAHHEAAMGLLNSIRTGDGRTSATAFTVISVGEEYALLRAFGLKPTKQALISSGGHAYDRLDVVDRDGKPQGLFFLVDRVLAAESAGLKKKQ